VRFSGSRSPSGSYNAASQPTTLTYGSGVQATIGYNSRLQLGTLDYKLGATDLLNLTYNYNQTVGGNTVNNGQIQGITDTRGNAFSTSYTYDALGRLSQGQTLDLTAVNTWKIGWVYDRYGNRSQQNLLGGTISTTAPQLTIDPASNRITTSGFQYDGAGDLTADGGVHSYAYDGENLVKSVDSTAATYAYDGKGMRVKKVVGATTTAYIFSGSKVIAEYTNGTLTSKYVYAGGQLLATVAGGVTYHYPDHLSARLETNATGTVTRTFGHLPFGETWYETGTAIKWKFTSYERDAESGLDYSIFRYDSSRLGRFMTRDPLAGSAADPQSLNRYSYVGNNPANFIDPLGLGVCPFLAPEQVDNCGGGEGGDAGGGGGYVDGSWTIGSLFSPSVGGSIPTWGPVWVPYSNSGVYVDGEFTINATTGYWTVGFLGFSLGTTGSGSDGDSVYLFSGLRFFKTKHPLVDSGPLNKNFQQPPEKDPIEEMLKAMKDKAEKVVDTFEVLMESIKNLGGGGTFVDLPLVMVSPCIGNPYYPGCSSRQSQSF